MRVIVFFDLPSVTTADLKEYRRFRRFLLKSGFCMMQESVYSKLVLNTTAAYAVEENLRKQKPSQGLVQVLTVTEKQYNNIEIIVGENHGEHLETTERLVVL